MDVVDYVGVVALFYWIAGLILVGCSLALGKVRAIVSYGKHARGWVAKRQPPAIVHSLLIKGTVPNKVAWTSLYSIGLVINSVLIREYFYLKDMNLRSLSTAIMFEIHVARRLIECIYVHVFTPRYLPLFHYAAAVSFYFFAPLTPFLDALLYPAVPSPSQVAAAAILFSAASLMQCFVHIRLAESRALGGSKYGVPRGGLFELVASPHYTAEIVMYTAFLIASNGLGFFAFLNWLWVFGNLAQSALETNAWYQRTFVKSMLPPRRKALIPHIL
mmetsp:Transcript_30723/g.117536  ORF Transcript_30723/g.117536 Transcript_30723/m.117536 type:complete len:274 (+) Transcript_30723:82-903(+)